MEERKNGQLQSQNYEFDTEVLAAYNQRAQEINLFFDFLEKLESSDPPVFVQPEQAAEKVELAQLKPLLENSSSNLALVTSLLRRLEGKKVPFEMGNILKANAILLLYNLIEAVVDKAETFVLKTVNEAGLTYESLSPEWKAIWIEQKPNRKDMKERIAPTRGIKDIEGIKKYDKTLFGNLDASKIDKLLVQYGIEATKPKLLRQQYIRNRVKVIKDLRSDLSHGNSSFADVGENLQIGSGEVQNDSDIKQLRDSVYEFLFVLLENTETFVVEQVFKA